MSVLDQQSKLNGSAALYAPASGGGGGGGGPVLNVSTINFNSVGSDGTVPAQQNMRNGGDGAGGLGAFNGAVLAFDMDPGPVSTMLFGYNSANNALQITQNTNDNLTSGALQVDAIFCSTINGAVPGGGGGGPTQSISSITNLSSILFNVAGGDGTTPYQLNIYGQGNPSQVVFANGGISAPAPASIYSGMYASTLVNALSNSYAGCFLATQDPGFVNSQLVVGSIINDGNVIASTDQNRNTAPLNIIANPLAVSSLVVSSINGLAPGGGGSVPPNLGVSTLTLNSQPVATGGTLAINANDANLYQFRVTDSNAAQIAALQLGTIGGRNQVYSDIGEIPLFYTSSIVGTTGTILLNPTGTEQIRIGGIGAPGDISINTVGGGNIILNGPVQATTAAPVTISTLTVSTINGVVPGGGGTSPTRVALNGADVNNNISVPGAMSPGIFQQVSAGYSVVANNTYRMTAVVDLSGTVDGQFALVIYGGGIGGLPETVWQFPNDNTLKGQGVSCTFRVGNTGTVYVGAENTATNSSDNVLLTVGAALWVFENLGALG